MCAIYSTAVPLTGESGADCASFCFAFFVVVAFLLQLPVPLVCTHPHDTLVLPADADIALKKSVIYQTNSDSTIRCCSVAQ